MISRRVALSPRANEDLLDIYSWVADAAGVLTAERYVDRLKRWCSTLELAAQRGTMHDYIVPGLRVVGFERRITVAFIVDEETVTVLRFFRAGQDWQADFLR